MIGKNDSFYDGFDEKSDGTIEKMTVFNFAYKAFWPYYIV
jgi:hypothetical protein